jgi:phosphoglycerate dehydrogenase-like enzyme
MSNQSGDVNVVILTHSPPPEGALEALRRVSPRLKITCAAPGSPPDLTVTDVLYSSGRMPNLEGATSLRWIQGYYAGVDHVLASGAIPPHVRLTSASGIHGPVMAEFVLMMMLAHSHGLPRLLAAQARRNWDAGEDDIVLHEMRDATVGIVGYGSIGRETARLASAFGMRVLACKRRPEATRDDGYQIPGTGDPFGELPAKYFAFSALDEMLPECDYVVLAAPLTAETRHMINADTLRAMKSDAFLVNVGRGDLVEEPALTAALRAGTIGGAALDVFSQEPLPSDSEFWMLPNVIVSPHISGNTDRYLERAMNLFAENMRRYLSDEQLLNLVDVDQGY